MKPTSEIVATQFSGTILPSVAFLTASNVAPVEHWIAPVDIIKLIIVSESRLLCEGIATLLSAYLPVTLTATYSTALLHETPLPPVRGDELVLLDGGIGREAALTWTNYWRGLQPALRLIVLELANDYELILDCIEAGASGYTLRGYSVAQLAETIQQVQQGRATCSPDITAQLFARLATYKTRPSPIPLTERELEVLREIAANHSNQAIANKLYIGLATVKRHVHNILEKLELADRREAVAYARDQGWIVG